MCYITIIPHYYKCMATYIMLLYMYPVGHSCSYPGCGSVLVLDGNMKNHRDICSAKSAGSIEFKNLPVQITTGCINKPILC